MLADDSGSALSQAIDRYVRTGELRSFFDLIDDIEPYGSEDRRGPGLADIGDGFAGEQVLDVSVWAAGTLDEARARVQIIEAVLAATSGRILLRSVSSRRSYLRVSVTSDGMRDLLETSVVETVRTPPVPYLDFRDWRDLGVGDIRRAETSGAVVGVLDDSPESAHPLLNGLVLSDDSLAPPDYQWQQRGSHGSEVIGRVLYPRLHEELRDLTALTAVGAVRVVRVLEPDPQRGGDATRFPTYALPHEVVAQGIRHLHDTYGVKIFNMSVGYSEPYSDLHVGPLTETLDDLIRELDIVIVVPTGNAGITLDARTVSGHHIIDDKPDYFFTPEHRIAEPAPAALAVTVGSIALSGAAAELGRIGSRAVAEAEEASPFSRSGPGLGTAQKRLNKPELTHYGGNIVVNDSGHAVRNDLGASLVSTSYRAGDGRLFAVVNGTSFAAPAVARVAADISYEYPDASANLIRALLASSAAHPVPAAVLPELHNRSKIYGYGKPRRERAIASDQNRVTMTYEGTMSTDTVQIHPFPVPELFRRGSGGERAITVALAFDPPVRRQRREYLAGAMKIDVYRDIDPDELAEILKKQDPDDPNEPIKGRQRLNLEPGSNSFTNSTLHVRRWSAKNSFVNDDETFFVVVTHKAQTWARDDPQYKQQRYALAVTLEDQHLVQADLYQLLTQQVQVPARVRLRA
ncbi:S8 family serine peptidase [Microbacterium betulae]|uniref:S8 family serine peptidase n=1 Tax=Microbacterium betulae TaxID=2981139 RepID=A0AA97I8L2_9MICO|nr:S8 family serine peptidase [Microbacterium sp. AB]WOF24615.1 S8 family serine peptidase [Microbacterium sp. AB]